MRLPTRIPFLVVVAGFLVQFDAASADETNSPQSCFDNKNESCLEAIYKDFVTNQSKTEAMYLHGQ